MKRCKFAGLHFAKAGGWLDQMLYRLRLWGITMPWRMAYVGSHRDRRAIRHELVHLAQIRRDGDLKFWILYFYYILAHGYAHNPYEKEADRLAGTNAYRE